MQGEVKSTLAHAAENYYQNRGTKMTKDYWDGTYYEYLVARMNEANDQRNGDGSALIKNDIKIPADKTYELYVDMMSIESGKTLLDLGCGFGRTFKYFFGKGVHVTGVDISYKMIDAARQAYSSEELQMIL